MKNLPIRDSDEEISEIRDKYDHLYHQWEAARIENDDLRRQIDHQFSLSQKHEFDMQKQVETVAYLNDEVRFSNIFIIRISYLSLNKTDLMFFCLIYMYI